jgi:hypothetical protein
MRTQLNCSGSAEDPETSTPDRYWKLLAPLNISSSGQGAQVASETVWISSRQATLDFTVGTLPDRNGPGQQCHAFRCQSHQTAPPISVVRGYRDQSTPLQWLQCCSQCGSIHCQQGCHCRHLRRFRLVEPHQQRKLSIPEVEWSQRVVKAPCQRSGGALHMKAEATIANQNRCLIRNFEAS